MFQRGSTDGPLEQRLFRDRYLLDASRLSPSPPVLRLTASAVNGYFM
jgi:hypothetical protein